VSVLSIADRGFFTAYKHVNVGQDPDGEHLERSKLLSPATGCEMHSKLEVEGHQALLFRKSGERVAGVSNAGEKRISEKHGVCKHHPSV
jgi:hypothetical protein